MIFQTPPPPFSDLRARVAEAHRMDETLCVQTLMGLAQGSAEEKQYTADLARSLVAGVRTAQRTTGGLDAFLHEYELSSREGVVLMCLAEALLRIPDADTASRLIQDKLADADWREHLGRSESVFVNASTWGLMLTGRVVNLGRAETGDVGGVLGKLVSRSGEPVIRQALVQAMRIMGRQFVLGRTIGEALERARKAEQAGYLYSYDMLGEAARTMADAEAYFEAYTKAGEAHPNTR
jgi:RHH-type proline utilization regulon transcriptional repressor/proline dehydrogenase/delta 1-pyrroline-5-carboxylate dehydrogenase